MRQAQAVDSMKECKMLVHIIRGTDIPIRKSYMDHFYKIKMRDDNNSGSNDLNQIFSQKQVEPFVEVRMVNNSTKEEEILWTSTSEG
mmetsp:Transcript_37280/g.57189  ORF Transcript_37280/g.57189 Transcript_37280/m.57189 type:complete len:87 (+) Transcript_37280:2381-2641(+)